MRHRCRPTRGWPGRGWSGPPTSPRPAPARPQPDRVQRLVRHLARHPEQLSAGSPRARGASAGATAGGQARPGGGAAGDWTSRLFAGKAEFVRCSYNTSVANLKDWSNHRATRALVESSPKGLSSISYLTQGIHSTSSTGQRILRTAY